MAMPTDAERREVARRLREVEGYAFPDRRVADHPIAADIIAAAVMYDLPDVKGLLGRLADLIEPSEPEGTCGNCKHFIKDRFMPCAAAHGYTEADVSACEDFSPLSCDRDALLEIVQAMDSRGKCASEENGGDGEVDTWWLRQYAHLIRETLGVDDGW